MRPGETNATLVDVALLDVLDQTVHRLVELAVVDRDRVLVAGPRAGAQRQHERVVLDLRAGGGVRDPLLGVDPRELVDDQLGAGLAHDRRERVAAAPRG